MLRKYKPPRDLDYGFRIYPPGGGHKRFRIFRRDLKFNTQEAINIPELDNINSKFLSGELDKDKAREMLETLRQYLYEREGAKVIKPVRNTVNSDLLEQFWKSVKSKKTRNNEDPISAKREYERALEAIGDLDLKTTTLKQLQSALDKALNGERHIRATKKLNTLLDYLDKDFRLEYIKKPKRVLNFIDLKDLPKLLECLPDDDTRTLHEVCFYTGVLIGEAFALEPKTYDKKSDTVTLFEQLDRSGNVRESRTKRVRTTIVLPEGREALMHWFRIRDNFPQELRKVISRHTRTAALKAFPGRRYQRKHITFQDLRHSYAIHLLQKGAPIGAVAECLGISEPTARETYGQYILSNDMIQIVSQMMKVNETSKD